MSKPSISSALAILDHSRNHHHPPPPPPAGSFSPPPPSSAITRDYRKGNWTLQETLILITAKRLDDDRRACVSSPSAAASSSGHRPAELRWKWVENYCWKNGCFRSQNQCNDKWDNLLRDYKKVRDYQARSSGDGVCGSRLPLYWSMEKHERKERNLPSNLSSEVFDALTDVLSRRNAHRSSTTSAGSASPLPFISQPVPINLPAPISPPDPPAPAVVQLSVSGLAAGDAAEMSPEQSSSTRGAAEETEGKKRRRDSKEFGPSLAHGVSVLTEALMACEEKRDKRHRERVELEERRLRLEADRAELHRLGLSSLVSAVNNLSAAIHSLASHHHHHP